MDETKLEDLIDEICDRFEAAWLGGGRPRLEDELDAAPDPARDKLLGHLMGVELAYRARLGERPTPEEYRIRLPEDAQAIDEAFTRESRRPTVAVGARPVDIDGRDPIPLVPGCDVGGELGRGGMGRVLRGRDPALRRELAVKVLLERHAARPEMAARFVEEAQIGGQLQHPGIVPVYELGTTVDGRPYFTMKLVRGRTLASLLADRESPTADLSRFVGIFEQVAQAVAYAHTRGVIHRDLKPSNVMVGKFGEVQVMDWGLAKTLGDRRPDLTPARPGQPPAHDETIVATAREDSDEGRSRTGSVLGTPAYMPPEQARGEATAIDRRADVFALGSILCKILTGEAAYTGRDPDEVFEKAARTDLADASGRLDRCGADAELVELARRCLSVDPAGRPEDAGEITSAIETHLLGVQARLRRAELERAEARARAVEERKRRRLAVASAAVIVAMIALGGVGWNRVEKRRAADEARVARTVEQRLGKAEVLRLQALAAPPEAIAPWEKVKQVVGEAEALLEGGGGPPDLRRQVEALAADLDRRLKSAREAVALGEKDRTLLGRIEGLRSQFGDDFDFEAADDNYVKAFREFGVNFDSSDPRKVGAKIASRPIVGDLIAAIDEWAIIRRKMSKPSWSRIQAVVRAVDHDRWRAQLRDDPPLKDLRKLASADLDALPLMSVLELAKRLFEAGDLTRAISIARRTQGRHPEDYWSNNDLARYLLASNLSARSAEALRFLTVLVALKPENASARSRLATGLLKNRHYAEAEVEFRESLRLRPGDGITRVGLGNSLYHQSHFKEAEDVFSELLRDEPDSSAALVGLGNALGGQGKVAKAEAAYEKALKIKPDNSPALINLANLLNDRKQFARAEILAKRALRLEERSNRRSANAGVARTALVDALKGQGKTAEAASISKLLAPKSPAKEHVDRGEAAGSKGDFRTAMDEARKALESDPSSASARSLFIRALKDFNKNDEVIDGLTRLRDADENPASRVSIDICLDAAYLKRANARAVTKNFAGAIADYDRAIELEPDNLERWRIAATLRAMANDKDGYRLHCRKMLDKFSGKDMDDAQTAERAAKACLLIPIPGQEQDAACDLARKADSLLTTRDRANFGLYVKLVGALADFRSREFQTAIAKSDEIVGQKKNGRENLMAPAHIVRSMALAGLGRLVEARAARDRGSEIYRSWKANPPTLVSGMGWYDREAVGLLIREAEGLLDRTP